MLPVEFNFGKKVPCFGCGQSDDTDRHLLECAVLKMACPDLMENTESVYNDVFSSDMTKVQKVANLFCLLPKLSWTGSNQCTAVRTDANQCNITPTGANQCKLMPNRVN